MTNLDYQLQVKVGRFGVCVEQQGSAGEFGWVKMRVRWGSIGYFWRNGELLGRLKLWNTK